jgi:hypothetical protein
MQIFLLALFGLIGIWPGVQPLAAGVPQSSASVQQSSDWIAFKSLDGGFEAAMPKQPQTNTLAIELSGRTIFTHIVSANDLDLNEYLVSWSEYPEKSVEQRATEKTFNRMRDALIRQKEGKLLSDTMVTNDGYPARKVVFALPGSKFVTVMFCFVRNRSYQVLIETKDLDSPTVDRFFSSFKLLPVEPV